MEGGIECEVCVEGMRLEYMVEFKYLEFVLNASGTDEGECLGKVAATIRSVVKARGLVI